MLVEADMAVPDFGCARKLRTVVVGKRLESAALARHAGTGFMWRLRACVRTIALNAAEDGAGPRSAASRRRLSTHVGVFPRGAPSS